MTRQAKPLFRTICAFATLLACSCQSTREKPIPLTAPPEPRIGFSPAQGIPPLPKPFREFRGLWIASVYNIDWPSAKGLSAAQLAIEADRILDAARAIGINAVFFQTRAAADALYLGSAEPWSASISGRRGTPPPANFDPLAYFIAGARARGILCYAWINPFRAGLSSPAKSETSPIETPDSPGPPSELVKNLDSGLLWLDPGSSAAREYVVSVAVDIVARYAPDGLVVDDYMYPYQSMLGGAASIPDDESYAAYRASGGMLNKASYRVHNASEFMRLLSRRIEEVSPGMPIGASPFGIRRSGEPEGIRGASGIDETGIDLLEWAREGLVDFASPQLYWPTTAVEQSYPILLAWWKAALESAAREGGREAPALWPSIAPFGKKLDESLRAHEAASQALFARALLGEASGVVLYSARPFSEDRYGVYSALSGPFGKAALWPPLPARAKEGSDEARGPRAHIVSAVGAGGESSGSLHLEFIFEESSRKILLYSLREAKQGLAWKLELLPARERESLALDILAPEGRLVGLAVCAADARGRLGALDLRIGDAFSRLLSDSARSR